MRKNLVIPRKDHMQDQHLVPLGLGLLCGSIIRPHGSGYSLNLYEGQKTPDVLIELLATPYSHSTVRLSVLFRSSQ